MDEDFGWCQDTFEADNTEKLSIKDLLFPENLSSDLLQSHLINRSVIKKGECRSKGKLLELFRKHISPLPKRNSSSLKELNAKVKAVSLTIGESNERKRKADGGKELTIKMPAGNKSDNKSFRPVKIKRKPYDKSKTEEQVSKGSKDSPDKMNAEISSPTRSPSTYARIPTKSSQGEKLASRREKIETVVFVSTSDSTSTGGKRNFVEKGRKVRLAENVRAKEGEQHSGNRDLRDEIQMVTKHKDPIENDKVSTIPDQFGADESLPLGKETIQISIGSDKKRSLLVFAKEEEENGGKDDPAISVGQKASVFSRLDGGDDVIVVSSSMGVVKQEQPVKSTQQTSAKSFDHFKINKNRASKRENGESRSDRKSGESYHRPKEIHRKIAETQLSRQSNKEGYQRNTSHSKSSNERKERFHQQDNHLSKDVHREGRKDSTSQKSVGNPLPDVNKSNEETTMVKDRKKMQEELKQIDMQLQIKRERKKSESDDTKSPVAVESASINLAIHGTQKSVQKPIHYKPNPSQLPSEKNPTRLTSDSNTSSKKSQPAKITIEDDVECPKPLPLEDHSNESADDPHKASHDVPMSEKVESSAVNGASAVSDSNKADQLDVSGTRKSTDEKDEKSSNSPSEDESESESSPKKKSKSKKSKRRRKRKQESSDSDTSTDDDESDEEDESERESRRKHKKHKRSTKKSKKKKKKKKRKRKGTTKLTAEELDDMKEKMKEEILKDLQEKIPNSNLNQQQPASSKEKKVKSDTDSLELDYSSEEPYDQHGFLTGIPLKKDASELLPKTETNETNVVEVLENVAVDDLDYDLTEESPGEENWKRQKKDDEESSKDVGEKEKFSRSHLKDSFRSSYRRVDRRSRHSRYNKYDHRSGRRSHEDTSYRSRDVSKHSRSNSKEKDGRHGEDFSKQEKSKKCEKYKENPAIDEQARNVRDGDRGKEANKPDRTREATNKNERSRESTSKDDISKDEKNRIPTKSRERGTSAINKDQKTNVRDEKSREVAIRDERKEVTIKNDRSSDVANRDEKSRDVAIRDQRSKEATNRDEKSREATNVDDRNKEATNRNVRNREVTNRDEKSRDVAIKDQRSKEATNRDEKSREATNVDNRNKKATDKNVRNREVTNRDEKSRDVTNGESRNIETSTRNREATNRNSRSREVTSKEERIEVTTSNEGSRDTRKSSVYHHSSPPSSKLQSTISVKRHVELASASVDHHQPSKPVTSKARKIVHEKSQSSVSSTKSFHSSQLDDTSAASDGIAIAQEVRQNIVRLDTFWKDSSETAFDPCHNAFGKSEDHQEELEKDHQASTVQSKPVTNIIGDRLQKIADPTYVGNQIWSSRTSPQQSEDLLTTSGQTTVHKSRTADRQRTRIEDQHKESRVDLQHLEKKQIDYNRKPEHERIRLEQDHERKRNEHDSERKRNEHDSERKREIYDDERKHDHDRKREEERFERKREIQERKHELPEYERKRSAHGYERNVSRESDHKLRRLTTEDRPSKTHEQYHNDERRKSDNFDGRSKRRYSEGHTSSSYKNDYKPKEISSVIRKPRNTSHDEPRHNENKGTPPHKENDNYPSEHRQSKLHPKPVFSSGRFDVESPKRMDSEQVITENFTHPKKNYRGTRRR